MRDHLLDAAEAETGAGDLARDVSGAMEWLKDVGEVSGRDANAVIAYTHDSPDAPLLLLSLQRDLDLCAIR